MDRVQTGKHKYEKVSRSKKNLFTRPSVRERKETIQKGYLEV